VADETQTFKLDLDTKGFISGAQEAQKVLSDLGDVENISGLLNGFETLGVTLGVLGGAFLAVKASFDIAFEAEKIQKINDQFNMLAANAGVSATEIREGMEKAAGGMATTTDLIQAANKAIVELGVNADKIPALMEVARKVTAVMGGDMIDNFERISKAVASGNTMMLRRMGLIVDNTKAQLDLANANHKFVDDLTDAEKKTAALNSVLALNSTSLKGVKSDMDNVTNTTKQIKVMMSEAGEAFSLFANKYINPILRPAVQSIRDVMGTLTRYMKQDVGEGTELASNKFEYFSKKAEATAKTIGELQERLQSATDKTAIEGLTLNIRAYTKEFNTLSAEADKWKQQLKSLKEEEEKKVVKPAETDSSGKGAAELKMNEELLKLRMQRIQEEINLDTSYEEIQKHRGEELVMMNQEVYAKIAKVKEDASGKGELAERLAKEKETELLNKYYLDVQKVTQEMEKDQLKAAQNAANVNTKSTDAFSKGWHAASLNASKDLGNFSKLGDVAFSSLNKQGKAAFIALGDGSKSAGDAMKGFLLGSIADIAEAQGEFLLASGIGTFNPIQIAEGGALLALSGLLRSAAGGASSSLGASTGGGGGGGGGGGATASTEATPATATDLQNTAAAQGPQKNVTIQVQGNYFETEQTKRTLMEMIRQETDATSFSYVQIPQGGAR